jgi:membrane associated rhomboid family serine protease
MDAPNPLRQPMFFVPKAVLWLLAALVAVHAVFALLPAETAQNLMVRFAFMPIRYAPGIDGGGVLDMAVPFLSHQFLHASWFHLIMNAAWLLACGPVVARRFGPWLFLAFFLVCGGAGAALFLAMDWGGIDGMIGASGAVSGLMAASIRMIPWSSGMPRLWQGARMPLVPLTARPVIAFTGIWFVTNLIFGVTGFGAGGAVHQIAWQAHIGGYVAGLLLAGVFDALSRRRLPPEA